MAQSNSLISNVAVTATRTGIGGVTALGAGRRSHNSFVIMAQSNSLISNVAVAATRTGIGGVTSFGTGCIHGLSDVAVA